jgi:ATP-dependent DNA helicase RecG
LLILFNINKVEYWDSINSFIEQNGRITNVDVRSITNLDTLKASKLLKKFVNQGLLEMVSLGNNQNTYYVKKDSGDLLSQAVDKTDKSVKKVLKNKG